MSKHASGRHDADAPFTLDHGETPGTRALRLEHLLFEELYRLFRMEVNDPRLAELEPTSVQMSPDLRNAKVMYALRSDPEGASGAGRAGPKGAGAPRGASERAIAEALLRVTPFLRARLADVVAMKRLPDLHFHRDRLAEASLRAQALMTAERLAASQSASASVPSTPSGPTAAPESPEFPESFDSSESPELINRPVDADARD